MGKWVTYELVISMGFNFVFQANERLGQSKSKLINEKKRLSKINDLLFSFKLIIKGHIQEIHEIIKWLVGIKLSNIVINCA